MWFFTPFNFQILNLDKEDTLAQVNFYRGENVSLPNFKNGAIYVIADTNNQRNNVTRGDIYVDMNINNGTNTRVHIAPDIQVIPQSQSAGADYILKFNY